MSLWQCWTRKSAKKDKQHQLELTCQLVIHLITWLLIISTSLNAWCQLRNWVMDFTCLVQRKSMPKSWMVSWLSELVEATWILKSSLLPTRTMSLQDWPRWLLNRSSSWGMIHNLFKASLAKSIRVWYLIHTLRLIQTPNFQSLQLENQWGSETCYEQLIFTWSKLTWMD